MKHTIAHFTSLSSILSTITRQILTLGQLYLVEPRPIELRTHVAHLAWQPRLLQALKSVHVEDLVSACGAIKDQDVRVRVPHHLARVEVVHVNERPRGGVVAIGRDEDRLEGNLDAWYKNKMKIVRRNIKKTFVYCVI